MELKATILHFTCQAQISPGQETFQATEIWGEALKTEALFISSFEWPWVISSAVLVRTNWFHGNYISHDTVFNISRARKACEWSYSCSSLGHSGRLFFRGTSGKNLCRVTVTTFRATYSRSDTILHNIIYINGKGPAPPFSEGILVSLDGGLL